MTDVSHTEDHAQPHQAGQSAGRTAATMEMIAERLARMERKLDQLLEQPRPTEDRGFRGGPPRDFRSRTPRFGGHRAGGGYDRKFPPRRYEGRDGRDSYGDRRPRADERRPMGASGSGARPDPFAKFRKPEGAGRRGPVREEPTRRS